MRLSVASKNFINGQTVIFRVWDSTGALILQKTATEWAGQGIYYIDITNPALGEYLVGAGDTAQTWKVYKHYTIN